jgi:hypothetical protein
MEMSLLPEFAVAQLVMLKGSMCSVAELAIYLEQFGYQEDPHSQNRWVFVSEDQEHAECCLLVENEGELVTVYGDAADHFTNINYVMHKAGWLQCSVLSRTPDLEAKLLARLVSVDVSTATTDMPASTLQASVQTSREQDLPSSVPSVAQHVPSESIRVAETPLGAARDLDDTHMRIEQLTIRCNTAEERSAELESANQSLVQENDTLRRRVREAETSNSTSTARQMPPGDTALDVRRVERTVDAVGLVEAIEKHLSSQLEIPAGNGSPLLADLRQLGYEPRLRLIKVA